MDKCKEKILLSFILPIYNVETCLRECVDSILEQITNQCEIILVNDGSTDSSGEICRSYAESSALIHTINKENGGLSSARNAGLYFARGKYVTFVDSDDKIFPNVITDILKWTKSKKVDLCFLQSVKLYPDGSQVSLNENIEGRYLYLQKRENAVRYLACRPKYPGSAWGKLYRREFLLDNDLHFPYDRRFSEDLGFIRDCILKAKSMDALDILFYQYRQHRNGSITNRVSSENFNDLLRFITDSVEKLTVDKKPRDKVSQCAMGFVAYEYAVLLHLYNYIRMEDKKEALAILKEYQWTLKYAKSRKVYVTSLLCTFCGLEFTAYFLSQYRKASCK